MPGHIGSQVSRFHPAPSAPSTHVAVSVEAVHTLPKAQKVHGDVPNNAPGSVCVMHVAQSVAVHSALTPESVAAASMATQSQVRVLAINIDIARVELAMAAALAARFWSLLCGLCTSAQSPSEPSG